MNATRRDLHIAAIGVVALVLLTLSACGTQTDTPVPNFAMPLGTPLVTSNPAALVVALTEMKSSADNQAAATAEVERANAQANLDSANATLSMAQTQEQNSANVNAAQIAATVEIARANAQATLSSAGSTQSAALTQDAIRQTQMADLATTSAQALVNQQNKNDLAAGTQTAVANLIATQTQSALTVSQFRDQQGQAPIAFLWMWCLPAFILVFGVLLLWGFWRWLRIQQANQRIPQKPMDQLQPPATEVRRHRHDDVLPYVEGNVVDHSSKLTKPDDQVSRWVDEVKSKLRSNEKDEDDNTDN